MYPAELEIKDTTESTTSASYLDLLLSIGRDGQLHTSIYDKRDDFNFHITNCPFLRSNIPSSPAYGVFISQLIRYARACSSYDCFILRARRLSSKLLKQGYLVERLKSSFNDFPTDQTFHQFQDLYTELDLHRFMSGFHGAFATGVASQQGTLTLPDTWFRPPFWDLLMLQLLKNKTNHPISSNSHPSATAKKAIFSHKIERGLKNQQEHHIILTKYEFKLLRPNSSNLPCLYSTFHLEYPLVLSRFCFSSFFFSFV